MDFLDSDEATSVHDSGPRRPPVPPVRRPLPAFLPAQTVMPTVSYRQAEAPRVLPQVESVMEVLPRMPRATPAPAVAPQIAKRGELTVVLGCRGGAGATTLAVNTAAALAKSGRTVCIVDLDFQLGDVCVALDLEAQTSLSAVAREAHALDAIALRRRLAQHGSGVCALTQVGHLDDLDSLLPTRIPALLDTLRMHFDHVIVDGVRDFGDTALAALEAASRILLVVTQDVPAVRRAARALDVLGRLGVADARCQVVVNRAMRRAAVDDAALSRALGKPIAVRVREDSRASAALDAGALVIDVARSRGIAADLDRVTDLCRALSSEGTLARNAAEGQRGSIEPVRASTPARRGLFSFLRG